MILKEEDNGASYATGLYLKVLSKITKEHTNPNNINYIYFNNNRKNIDKIIIEKTIQDFINNALKWFKQYHKDLYVKYKELIKKAAEHYFNSKTIQESYFNY